MEIDLNRYKNIIFDLGGVILNIDYNLSVDAFKKLGLENFQTHFSQAAQNELFDLYEKGLITSTDFRTELKKHLKDSISVTEIDNAWNALLQNLPAKRLTVLEQLKNTHRTFLLSNTNEIHINEFNSYLKTEFHINDLANHFEKMYLSYEIGMRKPDKEIFEFVISENNLQPFETLFIDDSKQHIDSANSVGYKYLLVNKWGNNFRFVSIANA
ncbi:MAG: HAD family phosphatase [Bacteroidetes bacterium]|nr:HAD family phosphatase [Bacteroidota bacterium]